MNTHFLQAHDLFNGGCKNHCKKSVNPLIYTFIILIKNQINPPSRNYNASTSFIEKNSKPRFYQPLQSDLLKQESSSSI